MNLLKWKILSVQFFIYYKLLELLNDLIKYPIEINLSESGAVEEIKALVENNADLQNINMMDILEMFVWSSTYEDIIKEHYDSIERFNDLLKSYTAGRRNFRAIQIAWFRDYEGDIKLSDINLSYANLKSIQLARTNLSKQNLEGVDLSGAQLKEVNLTGANLRGANLAEAKLIQVNLTDADLTDADLTDTNFSGCIMPDGTLEATPQRIEDTIGYLKRKAWKPLVKEGDGDLKSSKFGGKPWLNSDEDWPTCPNCSKPMRFFLQINLEEIPSQLEGKFGKGILQFFYCANRERTEHKQPPEGVYSVTAWSLGTGTTYITDKGCDGDCYDEKPFPGNQLVRIIQPYGIAKEFEIPHTQGCDLSINPDNGQFPAKVIINWQELDDYPKREGLGDYPNDWEEPENLNIVLSVNDWDFLYDSDMYYPEIDKLAGWPRWVQDDTYPDCRICNQKMTNFIFQLISYGNIQFMWGDCGIGYVLQCPTHQEEVAFLWQCG